MVKFSSVKPEIIFNSTEIKLIQDIGIFSTIEISVL